MDQVTYALYRRRVPGTRLALVVIVPSLSVPFPRCLGVDPAILKFATEIALLKGNGIFDQRIAKGPNLMVCDILSSH